MKEILSHRPAPKERSKLVELYRFLVSNIDAVLMSQAQPHPHIIQLANKMEDDLGYSLEQMPLDQRQVTVLKMLRQKLQRRMNEMAERESKLDQTQQLLEMPQDGDYREPSEVPSLSETLWNDTISQFPKKRNLRQLQATYSEGIVKRFTEMLAEEKKKIIDKNRKRHNITVTSMKKELRDDVKEGLDRFMEARDEWSFVTKAFQDVKDAQSNVVSHSKPDTEQTLKTSWNWRVMNQLMGQLKQSQKHYEDEMRRGEELRLMIQTERQSNHMSNSFNTSTMKRLQEDNEELRDVIDALEAEIEQQQARLQDLTFIKTM